MKRARSQQNRTSASPMSVPCGVQRRRRTTIFATSSLLLLLLARHADCFSTSAAFSRRACPSTSALAVSQSATPLKPRRQAVAQAVQPKSSISATKRQQAKLALEQQKKRKQQQQVDAQMLQLLSEQFLYAEAPKERPPGRPACVPGAMKYDTMIQYRHQQREMEKEQLDLDRLNLEATQTPAQQPVKRGRGRPRKSEKVVATVPEATEKNKNTIKKNGVAAKVSATAKLKKPLSVRKKTIKGSMKQSASAKNKKIKEVKKRKRVVKNLPKSRATLEERQKDTKGMGVFPKGDPLNLQKYYRTELLTAEEEYSLGMKIQFMMMCEHVHEGLANKLNRLPSIQEWAEACGFLEDDPTFVPTEGDEQIRPAGSESMFQVVDPNTFVGNGLATNAGPGRGRGRVKQAPPTLLEDYYDDSEVKFNKSIDISKADLKPVNRGTALDFVEKMMDSRTAKQRMVQSNMRLVLSIARKYSRVGVSLPDLVQEGSLGLSRAAEKFEPRKGFKFSTYASWWIQQAVFRAIAYHSRTIRLPVHVHNLMNRVRRIRLSLEQDLGRAPTNEEIAEQLDMDVQKFNKMMSLTRQSISLEVPKYQSNPKDFGHESEDLLGETIAAEVLQDESSPEKRVDRGLFHRDLREMLKILETDERRVISARYGLDDGLTRTVTAVAAQLKESKSWVRSQECRALRKLRRPWYEKRLKEHQNSLVS